MKRAARDPARTRTSQGGRPCKPAKILPAIRRKDLPVVHLPRQTRSQGGKTKLTNHRAAIILHAISCGCYRETAAELASIKAETLSHWMGWSGEPYETFQRLVRKAEAGLESRMVTILTGQAEVRPELALAILERKFPQRWAKVTVVASPPQHLSFNVADILQKVQERIAQQHAQSQLPPATIINTAVKASKPHDPRPPRLADVSALPGDSETNVPGLRVKESLPEESVALVRVLGVVPAPQLFDYDLEIGGRPFHQCPRRTQGFSKLLPEEDRVCDCGRARPTGVRLRGIGRPLRRQDDAHGPARAMALVSKV